ncbi:MAG: undecaprenyl-diphosphate phosphatase [Clostridia bacterium]|nr:undecaprenyl-diphosphate phosphatase [Clostridia bacterium]MBQ4085342.1 undecaprenyl-diphosphate phosphatase [Clostridia bacterium]
MNVLQAVVLGAVQGLAEFLPVSSSGHLVLVQKIFGMETGSITLEVLMHLGTLIAVFAVYWREIWNMICHPWKSDLKWLVVATIPAVVVRLLYTDLFVKIFEGTAVEGIFAAIRDGLGGFIDTAFAGGFLGWAFLLTSGILMLGEYLSRKAMKRHRNVRGADAIVMGLMQAVAVLPGVSRSGSTIAGGRARGLSGKKTADFAFMMSIPAILGAVVMDGKDILTGEIAEALPVMPMIVGVLTSMVFGFIAIRFMIAAVKKGGMRHFAVYTFCLGLLVLVDQYITHIFF